jgi:uracil-DNA glycosylase
LVERELLIVNSIACRPNPVRPKASAIYACRARLLGELDAYPRRVVVTLGATPFRAITDTRASILVERGAGPRPFGAWTLVPTVHPAWVLRWKAERYGTLKHDLQVAAGLLGAFPVRPDATASLTTSDD